MQREKAEVAILEANMEAVFADAGKEGVAAKVSPEAVTAVQTEKTTTIAGIQSDRCMRNRIFSLHFNGYVCISMDVHSHKYRIVGLRFPTSVISRQQASPPHTQTVSTVWLFVFFKKLFNRRSYCRRRSGRDREQGAGGQEHEDDEICAELHAR